MRARALLPLAFLLSLTASAPFGAVLAQGDVAVAPSPPRPGTVWTVMNTVECAVHDNYAVVRVIADIANRGPDPEFPFVVQVPDDAFVTGLTITRDGTTFEADIEERAKARQQYDEWKAREQTGGLVEKQRGSQLYSFLINVAEFTSVRAVLTYERYLAAHEGVFELPVQAPVSGFGRDLGARFDCLIDGTDGVRSAWGDHGTAEREGTGWRLRHSVGPRPDDSSTPFVASYTLDPTSEAGSVIAWVHNGTGTFAHRFRAPADARQLPLDLVLVLDISGSMQGLKVKQMQDAATQVVGMLREEDRLHLVFFSSAASSPWEGLRNASAANRRQAAEEVQSALISGGTNIGDGIRRGFAAFAGIDWAAEEGRMPLLVFLTDGQPTSGVTDRAALRQAARDANRHGVNVFALAFGSDADWGLVSGLAADGNGTALRVPEGQGAEVDLRRFMGALTTPVLKDVTITYGPGIHAFRRSAPVLFAGSELLVIGTFDSGLSAITAIVRGQAPDGARRYEVDEPVAANGGSFLARLVAYEEIRHHLGLIAAEGEKPEWVRAITDLALRHGFVTDYTSLVLRVPERDVRQCDPCVAHDGRAVPAPSPAPAPTSGGPAASTAPGDPRAQVVSQERRVVAWDASTTPAGAGGAPSGSAPPPQATSSGPDDSGVHGELSKTPGVEAVSVVAAAGALALALRRKR